MHPPQEAGEDNDVDADVVCVPKVGVGAGSSDRPLQGRAYPQSPVMGRQLQRDAVVLKVRDDAD